MFLAQNLEIMKLLVKKGLDINAYWTSGETYLSTAVKLGELDFAKFIIENGGIINKKNKLDETPLNIVLSMKYVDIAFSKKVKLANLLIEKGASFDIEEDNLFFLFKGIR